MNVLVIGGACRLTGQLIEKLHKEGHRTYLLTGDKFTDGEYPKVFERYDFDYDNESMMEIFKSVHPSVTVYLGAFDTNYKWEDDRSDSVRFTSGLTNLLSAFSTGEYGRFVYLSSSDVYSGSYAEDITEEVQTESGTYKGMAIAMGESLCSRFQESRHLDIVTLRIDNMYYVPEKRSEVSGVIATMCLTALMEKRLKIDPGHTMSCIYIADAVEYIYRLMMSAEHFNNLYNISSAEPVTERELAEAIKSAFGDELEIVENSDFGRRLILSNSRYDEEFGIRIFHHAAEVAEKEMSLMLKKSNTFLYEEVQKESIALRLKKRLGRVGAAILPFVETAVFFIPFFLLYNRAADSRFFSNLDFYLLYVILIAMVFGQQQAIVAAVLSVMGYFFRQTYHQTGFQLLMDYNTYVWIAQLFILGLAVGYLRDSITHLRLETREEQDALRFRINDIITINNSNVRVKDILETQIVNQDDSIGKIYNITSQLERYMPEEVIFQAAEMVSKLMNTKDAAIYTVSNSDYARMASATSDSARRMGHSIRYREMGEVSEEILEKKVYINRQINDQYPHMAIGIFEDDNIRVIIYVWGISWDRMTLGQANVLRVISFLIQNALLSANRYMDAIEHERYLDGGALMETTSFSNLVTAFRGARDRGLCLCVTLKVDVEPGDVTSASEKLTKKLRTSDYLGTLSDGGLYVLLADSGLAEAEFVLKRFEEIGYHAYVTEDIPL